MTGVDLRYLDALFGAEPDGALVEIRSKLASGGMRHHFHPVDDKHGIAEAVRRLCGHTDVYLAVAPRTSRNGGREAIQRVHALWADCDGREAVEAVARFRPLPAIVVRSGSPGHLHAYWPLWPPTDPDQAEAANRSLAGALGADERATDAARILRPPGTLNHKHTPPAAVKLVHLAVEIFTVDDVIGDLPDPQPRRPARPPCPRPNGDDPLLTIAPPVYVEALTGREAGRDGKIACPFHDDQTPSLHIYPDPERGWSCYGCGRGGTIIDLGAALYDIEPRGAGYHQIRERIEQELRGAVR